MDLKHYQRRVVEEVDRYLRALAAEHAAGNRKHAAKDAWEAVGLGSRYNERRNGLNEDLPTICIKVPTGGGKTLLATQVLGAIYRHVLADRNGAGLVLWVVPSSQIYRDTIARLSDRRDMYRLMLEHAVSRRIEVWEKHELHRLSPVRLRDCLNILVVQLASTNRETKDQLKFFKDSGGNIVNHFPPETDLDAHRALREQVPNLEVIEGTDLLKTSVGNLVRICKPPVVVDEGHKATSRLARETIEGFNASIVVELSATPHEGANIVSSVSGQELLDEEMIKLPLNVKTSGRKKWQDLVTEARDKRVALARMAAEHESGPNGGPDRHVRPIALVQVQRTGKDQREKGYIHAEDVREYLRQKLDVAEDQIAVKTSDNDGLENVDLLDPGGRVEWIITKSALQEGWDCPFAYVLVSLDNTGSGKAMTQLVGRILRQPHQQRFPTPYDALNESYAFCLHSRPAEVLKQVKKALEKEGYEGEAHSLVQDAGEASKARPHRDTKWRKHFAPMYTRPFQGKIYLPRFCIKTGDEYEPLDYYRHLVSRVDVEKFGYEHVARWDIAQLIKEQKDRLSKVTIGQDPTTVADTAVDLREPDASVQAWLAANLEFPYLSHKQLREVVQRVCDQLRKSQLRSDEWLSLVKTEIRNRAARFVEDQIDAQTEAAFGELFDSGRMLFYLHCAECRFEMPDSIRVESKSAHAIEPLTHDNGDPIGRSLFDFVERDGFNDFEREVALVLDKDEKVLWWYRNKVGRDCFRIQGYRRPGIFPDFVVQGDHEGRATHRVLVVETKGEQLEGNRDTEYKRKVASYFDRAGKQVSWQQLGQEFKDHIFRFQVLDQTQDHGRDWHDALMDLLANPD